MLSVATDNEWTETLIALAGDNAGNAPRYFGKRSYDHGMVAQAIVWSRIGDAIDRRRYQTQKREAVVPPVPAPIAKSLGSATYDSVLLADLDFASFEVADQPQAPISVRDKARARATLAPLRRGGVYRLSRRATQSLSGIAAARRVTSEKRKRRKQESKKKVASAKRKFLFGAPRRIFAGKIHGEKSRSSSGASELGSRLFAGRRRSHPVCKSSASGR